MGWSAFCRCVGDLAEHKYSCSQTEQGRITEEPALQTIFSRGRISCRLGPGGTDML